MKVLEADYIDVGIEVYRAWLNVYVIFQELGRLRAAGAEDVVLEHKGAGFMTYIEGFGDGRELGACELVVACRFAYLS